MTMAHGFTEQGGFTEQAGFTEQGLVALEAALERHVSSGEVPGLVALVAWGDGTRGDRAQRGQVHVTVAGSGTLGARDTPGDPGTRWT
jgi:hypothetical protein